MYRLEIVQLTFNELNSLEISLKYFGVFYRRVPFVKTTLLQDERRSIYKKRQGFVSSSDVKHVNCGGLGALRLGRQASAAASWEKLILVGVSIVGLTFAIERF
jgi:hypothetical protein